MLENMVEYVAEKFPKQNDYAPFSLSLLMLCGARKSIPIEELGSRSQFPQFSIIFSK